MKFKIPYLLFIILALTYILFGYGVTITNDSVTNVDQIISLDLWSRSSHFSFHLFGIIFYLIFSKIFGLSAITSVEIMLAVFSATAAVALYQVILKKYKSVNQAIITVLIYSFASSIFRFSCQTEYLILVPSLGILSLYFYSKSQNLIAGIFFGLGLLTSPFLLLFAPIFLLFTSFKELFKKQNLILVASILAVYLTVNIFTYSETVSGNWSYGSVFNYNKEVLSEIKPLRIAAIYLYGYLRSFNIIIFILPFILYQLYRSNKELFYVFIITILIHLPVAIPEARFGGYQMTTYPVIAICSGYFLNNLWNKHRNKILLIIVLFTVINILLVFSERSFARDLKETYVQLSNNLENKSVLIVYQAVKPIKNIYAPNLQVFDLLSDYQVELAAKNSGFVPTDLAEIFSENDTVYLLESGVAMPDDHLKLLVSQFTKNQGAKVKGFALEKVKVINSPIQIEKLKGYSLDVYKLTKR
jgi:hypothetical protein